MSSFDDYCIAKNSQELTIKAKEIIRKLQEKIPGLVVEPVSSNEYVKLMTGTGDPAFACMKIKPGLGMIDFYMDHEAGNKIVSEPKHPGWNTKPYYIRVESQQPTDDIVETLYLAKEAF